MLIRSLSQSYLGLLIGNVLGLIRGDTQQWSVLWKSDFFYKQLVGSNPSGQLLFGVLFVLVSLPWLTFIPSEPLPQAGASVFLAIGYYIFRGFPLNFARMYVSTQGFEVKIFKQVIASVRRDDIVAVIKLVEPTVRQDILYSHKGKYSLLSLTSMVYFEVPQDIVKNTWHIPIVEVESTEQIWDASSGYSSLEKLLAYSTVILNPLTAVIVYVFVFGPFATVLWGLIVLEMISIFFGSVQSITSQGYHRKISELQLSQKIIDT